MPGWQSFWSHADTLLFLGTGGYHAFQLVPYLQVMLVLVPYVLSHLTLAPLPPACLACVVCVCPLCCCRGDTHPQLSMNQCSDAVWRLATEVMEANKKKDDTLDAVAEKLHMFSHITSQEGQSLAEGEASALTATNSRLEHAGCFTVSLSFASAQERLCVLVTFIVGTMLLVLGSPCCVVLLMV